MAIFFDGQAIPGEHGPVLPEPPRHHATTRKYQAIHGESEIDGGRGGRPIRTHIWIHNNFANGAALIAYLRTLDRRVGDHGTLEVKRIGERGVPAVYTCVTFKGFFRDELGPLPDLTGHLDGAAGTFWIPGVLMFYQLKID